MSDSALPPLNDTIGALELGSMAAAILYGVTSVQTYLYYRSNNDSKWLKGLIGVLWVLDTLHFAVMTYSLYVYTVLDFGNQRALGVLQWSLLASVAIPSISDTIVRGIFTYRLWRLSGTNWVLTASITMLNLVSFALSLFLNVTGFFDNSLKKLAGNAWAKFAALGSAVGTDVLIAASMCLLLAIRRTGFSRTDSVVWRLILYSISTGAFTSLCEICALIFCGIWPTRLIWVAMFLVLPELHINALLASLNAREQLRSRLEGQLVSISLLSPRGGTDPNSRKAEGTHGHGATKGTSKFASAGTSSSAAESAGEPSQTLLARACAAGEAARSDIESNADSRGET